MGFSTNNWVGSPGFSGGGGTSFNPSWSDSFKYDGGFPSGSGNNYSPGGFSGIGTDPDTWRKGFALAGEDPFGLNKNKDKKESPWGDFARFAGDKLSSYAQNRFGQGSGSNGLAVGGSGGVSQSGDLTILYPQPKQIIPAQGGGIGGTIGSIAGAALGTLIAPGIGTTLGGQLGGAIGGSF
jgi:hypothetical protein